MTGSPTSSGGSLDGLRAAVTRPGAGDDRLSRMIDALGGRAVAFPLTRIVAPADTTPLDRAAGELDRYRWIVVTSARAITPLRDALARAGREPSEVRTGGTRVCAVGPRTAAALGSAGFGVDLVPEHFAAEGVVEALTERADPKGVRILFPRAEEGREVIPRGLVSRGARVDVVAAYRSVSESGVARALEASLREGELDLVTFTAGSAVRSFLEFAEDPEGSLRAPTAVIALGPATAAVLTGAGLGVDRIAEPHSFEGLVSAILAWKVDRPRAGGRPDPPGR